MSNPVIRARDAIILTIILIAGIIASVWFAMNQPDCSSGCSLNIYSAVLAQGVAAGALFIAMAVLAFSVVREGDSASTSMKSVLIVLVVGIIAAIISVFQLEDKIFVADGGLSGTVAGISVGVAVLYLAFFILLLDLRGAFSGGHKRAPAIPVGEEDQHVMTIEGIGPKYATRLNARGFITIPQLLAADSLTIGKAAGATHQLAEQWQAEGALIQVKGIGPQYAEMLALAGVRSVRQLADANVDELLATIDDIEERRKVRVLKTDIKRHHVEKFVKAAQAHLAGQK